MIRPRTPVGSAGVVSCNAYIRVNGIDVVRPQGDVQRPAHWVASSRLRLNVIGPLRRIRVEGRTRQIALAGLHARVAELLDQARADTRHGGLGRSTWMTLLQVHLNWWLQDLDQKVAAGDRAVGTAIRYRHAVEHSIVPAMGGDRLAMITTVRIARFLKPLTPAVARTCRAVLRSAFDAALLDGAVSNNPAVGLPQIIRDRKQVHRPAGIDRAHTDRLLKSLYGDDRAVRGDVADVVLFIASTGCRTSEALALAWADVDLAAGTATICATVNPKGLRQVHTKTSAGMRTLCLPERCVVMLRRRRDEQLRDAGTLVFPAQRRSGSGDGADVPRWSTNFIGQLRKALDRLGYPGVTARSLRRMVATELDIGGLTSRQIADQLGHAKPSVTMDVYQIRTGRGPAEAVHLLR